MAGGGNYYDTMPISIDRLNLHRHSNNSSDIIDTRRNCPRLALYCGVVLILCVSASAILLSANSARLRKFSSNVPDEKNAMDQSFSAYHALEHGLNRKKMLGAVGCEATVLIVRHCEGGTHTNGHCNLLGFERASYLASLFGDTPQERWPLPAYLYATRLDRVGEGHEVYREVETLTPLSNKTGIPISFETWGESGINLSALIHSNLLSGEMCGKLAVISWKHDYIPIVAVNLGCGPLDGCPMTFDPTDYDTVWQLKFVYGTRDYMNPSIQRIEANSSQPEWVVFASLVKENFDPLSWSKLSGDYPTGGKSTGGSWKINTNNEMNT
jgi:hypothetical protein